MRTWTPGQSGGADCEGHPGLGHRPEPARRHRPRRTRYVAARATRPRGPHLIFAASRGETRAYAIRAGIEESSHGILGGVPAVLLLESKFEATVEVLAPLAVLDDALQEARSSLRFGDVLRRLMPEPRSNARELEARVQEPDRDVRAVQQAAEKAVERLFKKPDETSMYG